MQTVLFFRHFDQFSGGHLKVWDYFNHFRAIPGYRPLIRFSAHSLWDQSNPWLLQKEQLQAERTIPADFDLCFIAGLDWDRFDANVQAYQTRPVLNLIQHVRHADPKDKRYPFLRRRAIRICVSPEVATALRGSGVVNGPIVEIPYGIELPEGGATEPRCTSDLLIAALKQPQLGRELYQRLSSSTSRVKLLTDLLPREQFLSFLANTRVALLLPNPTEGYYLPALEAMSLGRVVVCPDAVGNRSFCLPGQNCFRPAYRQDAIVEATLAALQLHGHAREALVQRARETAAPCRLSRERGQLADLLANLNQLW
jgi:hypothetical protein